MAEHIHQPPGTEIQSIGGHYRIMEEGRLTCRDRIVMYWVGIAAIDSSCCGAGGCRFIYVPGYVSAWQHSIRPDGLPVSDVEPIVDIKDRKIIETLLQRQFLHSQVSFRDA